MKFKNFLYDKNDILVAAVILILAALIVLWRVDVIMDYPAKIVAAAGENNHVIDSQQDNHSDGGDDVPPSGEDPDIPSTSDIDDVEICAVYINYGQTLDAIAQNCVAAGLIGSVDEFITLVNEMGVAGSIQAGQHHIPSNATPAELIEYLTQPGL